MISSNQWKLLEQQVNSPLVHWLLLAYLAQGRTTLSALKTKSKAQFYSFSCVSSSCFFFKDMKVIVYLWQDALQTNCDSRFVPFTVTNPHLTENCVTSSSVNSVPEKSGEKEGESDSHPGHGGVKVAPFGTWCICSTRRALPATPLKSHIWVLYFTVDSFTLIVKGKELYFFFQSTMSNQISLTQNTPWSANPAVWISTHSCRAVAQLQLSECMYDNRTWKMKHCESLAALAKC